MKLTEQTLEHWTELAKQVATRIHEGQRRTNGGPYIDHPARVAEKVEPRLKPIAWLHDTVEDHPDKISIEDLKGMGFPSYIIDAVDLLTHRKGDTNMAYWKKIATNPDAVAVKLKDIEDNLGGNPTEYQIQKYGRALDLFKQLGYTV